jgi:hypothetical protein
MLPLLVLLLVLLLIIMMIISYNNNKYIILTLVYLCESLTAIYKVSTSEGKETKHTKLKNKAI